MIERFILIVGLVLSLGLNGWQWWYGSAYWRGVERAVWVEKIETKNVELREIAERATRAEEEAARLRGGAAMDVSAATPLEVLPTDIVRKCSYSDALRNAMNRIR